jgi:hypothetical protein
LPVGQIPGQHAAAGAVGIHDQVDREVFDEELRVVLERLLIERVQDRVTGPVRGRAGPLRRALAVVVVMPPNGRW